MVQISVHMLVINMYWIPLYTSSNRVFFILVSLILIHEIFIEDALYQPLFLELEIQKRTRQSLPSPFELVKQYVRRYWTNTASILRFHKKDTVLKLQVKMGFQLSLESMKAPRHR